MQQITWFDYSEKRKCQGTFPGSSASYYANSLPAWHLEGEIMEDKVLAFSGIGHWKFYCHIH